MSEPASQQEQFAVTQWGERGTVGPVFAGDIRWKDISYAIGGRTILNNVSFGLEPGQIGCLLGPSGCGKSTLLRIAAGITSQTSGQILLDGQEIAGPSVFLPPEKRSIGMMFQDFALFPHLTVLQNVMFGLYAVSKDQARRTAEQALDRVGLLRHGGHYPHALSGGEQQRVALARTVVPRPQVILMDEPFSGLDPQLRWTIRTETLALLRETRATALIVTHDADEAVEMADHIILMKPGGVAQQGTPDELYHQPATADVARYFSPLNEMTAIVRQGFVETPVGRFSARHYPDGAVVQLLVRTTALEQTSNPACAAGRVLTVHRRGPSRAIQVQYEGLAAPWSVVVPDFAAIQPGQDIRFSCRPENVLIFQNG